MRRIALLVAASALVGWGIAGALGGCGGDEAATPASPEEDASPSTSSSGDNGSNGSNPTANDGSPSSSGGPGGDAAPSSSSGNVVSNPGKLTCGATECDAGGGLGGGNAICCVREAGAAPACATANTCDNDDLELRCDEPADCPQAGGLKPKCCLRVGNDPRSECDFNNCPGGNGGIQLCKTNADCGDAGACAQKKCGAFTVRVCGAPQGCQ